MELLLGAVAACAVVVAAWAVSGRQEALAREGRLRDEISSLRRSLAMPAAVPLTEPAAPGLPPERASEPPPSPAPAPAAEPSPSPDASRARGPRPEELARLAIEAEQLVAALQRAAEALTPRADEAEPPAEPAPAAPALPADEAGPLLADVLDRVTASFESLTGERARMKDHLLSVEASAGRLTAAARNATALVDEAERGAQSVAPVAAALSGLADRMNLLALNVALLAAKAGDAGSPFEMSGTELRALFDEVRGLSRELGSIGQRGTGSARRAAETLADLAALADGASERAARAGLQLDRLAELGAALSDAIGSARAAADAAEADRRAGRTLQAARLSGAAAREEALRARIAEGRRRDEAAAAALALVGRSREDAGALAERLRRGWGPPPP